MQGLRFAAVALAAFSMSMSFCHLLELPARIGWGPELWIGVTVSGGVFRLFGSAGAAIEVAALGVAVAFAIVLRLRGGRGPAFDFALAGVLLLIAAHAAFWLLVAPVNTELAHWTTEAYPSDWSRWRSRWEYSHALRAILQCGGFAALLCAALEVPAAGLARGPFFRRRGAIPREPHPVGPPADP